MEHNESKIIDLSNASGVADLVAKISTVLDSEEVNNKSLFLRMGKVDLNKSQLLSIKALIEAMNSNLTGIETSSEMTEASAISLNITTEQVVEKPAQPIPSFKEAFKTVNATETLFSETKEGEISSFAQLKQTNSIGDFVTDTSSLTEVEEDENLEAETNEFLQEVEEEVETLEEQKEIVEEENIYETISEEVEISAPEDVQSALDVTFGEAFHSQTSITLEDEDSDTQYETSETIKTNEDAKYVLLDTEGITPEGIELIKSNTSDLPTMYLTQTLRSGQTVSYEGNIFIVGDAHPGSEINATGDITVWGVLGGIVHAGYEGNTDAKVRALKLNPIQLRIANLYSRRNDTVNVPYVQKTNEFTPEEARIDNDRIVIYKTLRRED